jgi:hypothetical protein
MASNCAPAPLETYSPTTICDYKGRGSAKSTHPGEYNHAVGFYNLRAADAQTAAIVQERKSWISTRR